MRRSGGCGGQCRRHAKEFAPVVADVRASDATSLRAIAGELNARDMLTRRGGHRHVSTVMNLPDLARAAGKRVRQSRLMSLVEAAVNMVVG